MKPAAPRTLTEKIIAAACQYYSCTEDQLKTRKYIEQKKILIYLLRENAMARYAFILDRFDLKDLSWCRAMVADIVCVKNIYPYISHDIKNILQIVDNLV